MSNEARWLTKVRDIARQGLSVNSLQEMVSACEPGTTDEKSALTAYLIQSVANDLLFDWDERKLLLKECRLAERKLLPALENIAVTLEAETSSKNLLDSLNALVKALQSYKFERQSLIETE